MKKQELPLRHRALVYAKREKVLSRKQSWLTRGQSTVEFMVVGVAFLALFLGLSAFLDSFTDGTFSQHIAQSASHALESGIVGLIGDTIYY